jgi:protein ImuB
MTLTAASALAPALHALERSPQTEARALDGLAAWAGQFTSWVSLVPARGLLLEIGGSLGLLGGPGEVRAQVRRGLSDLGYRAALAVAPTALGAWWLARGGDGGAVHDREGLAQRLARLPLAATDLSIDQQSSLEGLGLQSVGDLMRLPRAGLARRLGTEVVSLLDRALGRVPDPREPYTPPRAFAARLALPSGVAEVEALLFALRRLILELVGYLQAMGGGVERVAVGLEHPHPPPTRLAVTLAGPSRDDRHLQLLVRERLQRVCLPGLVEAVSLEAGHIVALDARSRDLFGERASVGEGWEQLVDRLRARLGQEAVHGLAAVADHRPERAWCPAPAGTAGPRDPGGRRPFWLLDPPRGLAARGERPCWGGVLTLLEGPERVEGGWWDGADVSRDYYVAENLAGERCWVFRERNAAGRWFLHGIFA